MDYKICPKCDSPNYINKSMVIRRITVYYLLCKDCGANWIPWLVVTKKGTSNEL